MDGQHRMQKRDHPSELEDKLSEIRGAPLYAFLRIGVMILWNSCHALYCI